MSHSPRSVSFGGRWFALLALWVGAVVGAGAALPSPWSSTDIGTVGVAGSSDLDTGTGVYTVKGSGAEVGGTSDNFQFAYQPVSGDVMIVARVQSLTNTSTSAKTGVMIRETLTANSKSVTMMVTPGVGVGARSRATVGGNTTSTMVAGITAPQWVKLERKGSVFTSYYSVDGVTWTFVQRIGISMASDVYVGLFACSRSTTALTTGVIDQILVDSPPALPWPWVESTVGLPTDPGVALFDGSYVLANLGADIASTSDKMKFVSQPLVGDGTLTIKVSSLTSGASAPRFGLMMRESLQPAAPNVLLGMTTPQDLVFQSRRTASGTTAARTSPVTLSFPTWLRLDRTGNNFTVSYSSNGTTWTQQGVETIAMPPVIQAGVAYSNRSTVTWGLGVGDALSLKTPADVDGNGLPDAWEIAHFGATGISLNADPDSDNLTNYQEWELGNDPLAFNALGQRPVVELVSGNSQQAPVGTDLPQPLVVRVKDSLSNAPASGVPVTFLVTGGTVSVGSASSWQSSLTVVTDENGMAQTSAHFSTRAGISTVQASVGGGQQAGGVTFSLKALAGEALLLLSTTDLGAPAQSGRVDYSAGAYTLGTVGTAISGATDTGHFASRDFTGDGYILAKVAASDSTDTWGRAGVMMRQSTEAGAPYAAVFITPGAGAVFQYRATAGGATTISRVAGITGPCWVLLRRSGDIFHGLFSTDGQVWQSISSSAAVVMPATVRAGLAVSAADTVYRNAIFTDLRLSPHSQSPWQVADIGTVNTAAIDDYSETSILVRGGGSGIGSTADKFRYVYQSMPHDGRIIARVASQLADQTTAKSGVMLRSGIGDDARNLLLATVPATGVVVQKRLTDGAYGIVGATQAGATPRWLKLEKLGQQVDAYTSTDGTDWSLVSTDTMDFGADGLVGIAANSTVSTAHSASTFDHIQVDVFSGARGWNASYYQGAEFGTLRSSRRDSSLDFSWVAGVTPAGVPAGAYSARWGCDLVPTYTETYTLTTLSQGGVRVSVDGQTVIDNWEQHGSVENTGSISLQAGVPVRIVVDYANASAASAGRIQVRWSSPSQADRVITTDALRPTDADFDGIPDAWETAHGLNPLDPLDASQDPDHDGMNNLLEYQLGYDLNQNNNQMAGKLLVEEWQKISGSVVADLTNNLSFPLKPTVTWLLQEGVTVTHHPEYHYGRRVRGFLQPPVDGDYQFWITGDYQTELWLSQSGSPFDRVRIDSSDTAKSSALVKLKAGQSYYFEILQKGGSLLKAEWSIPGGQRQLITAAHVVYFAPRTDDLDGDGLPDAWETTHGLNAAKGYGADGAHIDRDGDGLTNLEEYQLGTHPCLTDTDGDGINDYESVYLAEVDSTTGIFGSTAHAVVSLAGSSGTAAQGEWLATAAGHLEARRLRGSVTYAVSVAEAGLYRLDLTIMDAYAANPSRAFELGLKVDGVPVGTLFVQASGTISGQGKLYLPWLSAGNHAIEIVWENGRPDSFLRIVSLGLVNPGTVDANSDGVADWVTSRLAHTFVMDGTRVETHVSPFTVEGTSAYPQYVTATATYSPGTAGAPITLTVSEGLTRRWFAHVPLIEGATATVTAADAGGLATRGKEVVWTPLNLLELDDGAQQLVREGDRLLVSADAFELYLAESVEVTVVAPGSEPEIHTLLADETLEVPFATAGNYELWVTLPGEDPVLALTVKARAVQLTPAPLLMSTADRIWVPAGLPAEAVIETDPSLLLVPNLPTSSPRQFTVSTSTGGVSRMVARLGADGPIAAVLAIQPLRSYHGEKGKSVIVETFPDGTQLWKQVLDLGGPVPADLVVKINVFKAGASFDDGTLTRTFTASDFDENGMAVYFLLRGPDTAGSPCHSVKFYEGTTYLNYIY